MQYLIESQSYQLRLFVSRCRLARVAYECRADESGLSSTGETRSRPHRARTWSAPSAARAVAPRLGATGISRGELALWQSARIDRGACGPACGQGTGIRQGRRHRAAPFRRSQHGSDRGPACPRDCSTAQARPHRAAGTSQSRRSVGGRRAAAVRPASHCGYGAQLRSRQLCQSARARGGSRLRRHCRLMGPRGVARLDPLAGRARSLGVAQPAHVALHRRTAAQVAHFLQEGRFIHG
jgi:hypothetical protein